MSQAATIVTDSKLAASKNPIANAIKQLSAQVERAEIVDEETNAKGGDLYKIISTQLKKNEDARTALVKPLNDHVKWINAQFKPNKDKLEGLKATLKGKLDTYAAEKQAELDRIAEEQRKAAEEEALARAEEAQAEGDTELAETIVDEAASVKHKDIKQLSRGDLGSSTGTRKDWVFDVDDPIAFVSAWLRGELEPGAVTINESWIREQVRQHKGDTKIPGVTVKQKVSASVR